MYYYSLNEYLKNKYDSKVYKLSLNAGLTCPNRDGKISHKGCLFCSEGGSGDFAADCHLSIYEQIETAKKRVSNKIQNGKYIAYFQAYTNTYASVKYLRKIFMEAINHPEIVALSIATRPDCLPSDVIALLNELNKIKPVWVELGLQTIHEESAIYINRGYRLSIFNQAVIDLNNINVDVIVHVILGLPNETKHHIIETIDYISHMNIKGIKLQLLHVLKNTPLEKEYSLHHFDTLSLDEYIELLSICIEHIPQNIIIHRLTGDGPKSLLVAPKWSSNKKMVLNSIHHYFTENNIIQGRLFR